MKTTATNPAAPIAARHRYSQAEQLDMIRADLLSDAEQSEAQAIAGPFYPDKGITAESCRAYAAECREKAARRDFTVSEFIAGKVDAKPAPVAAPSTTPAARPICPPELAHVSLADLEYLYSVGRVAFTDLCLYLRAWNATPWPFHASDLAR